MAAYTSQGQAIGDSGSGEWITPKSAQVAANSR
jgi:hypothetical protein